MILVARNEDKLKELSNYLSQTFYIKSVFIVYGLEKPEAAEYVFHRVQELGLKIDVFTYIFCDRYDEIVSAINVG